MSLVVVGSVAYDGVETPHGRVDRMLGGAATYISLASSLFHQDPHLVAVVGDDFAAEDAALLASPWYRSGGPGAGPRQDLLLGGRYSDDMNDRITLAHGLERLRRLQSQASGSYRSAPYLLLGNIQPALQAPCARR